MHPLKHFSLCLFLASLLFQVNLVAADTISIRADEWFPINGEPNSNKPGYMIEMASTILAQHGHTVDYKTMPWERSLDQVRKGNFDCVVGAYKDDAPDFIFPELSWGLIETSFYIKKGNAWRYNGMVSLKDISVGTIGGYAYSEEFDAYVEAFKSSSKVQVLNANNALEQNIKKLLAGRVDTLVESDLVMIAKLDEMGVSEQVEIAGLLNEAEDMYIACSPAKPGSSKLVKILNDGLIELRQSGELKTILRKYGLKDWQKQP